MQYFYEMIKGEEGLPIKAFIHSVNGIEMHWHNEMEIILVLQGSVNVRVGNKLYILNENDLILINRNEIHNVSKTKEDNILVALQIDLDQHTAYYPKFNRTIFDCKSFHYNEEEQESFNTIRHYIAKILWELNKKRKGYQLILGSDIHMLAAYLYNNFSYSYIDDEKAAIINKDIDRLQNIIGYINDNLDRGITLKEIADSQQLSIYYLSHFIKKNLGFSFQEYLMNMRLDKAINMLIRSNKTITEISYASGFPSTKSLNKHFKETFGCSPTEYKRKNIVASYTDKKTEVADSGGKKSKTYLDVDRKAALKRLFTYLKPLDNNANHEDTTACDKEIISVNLLSEGISYDPYWKKLTTFGRAAEGLRKGWQDQLKELQDEIGFEYIRFHGIFCDEMMICNFSDEGNIIYNWSYVDELFDYFKKVSIKPFIELGFMPSEIKKSDEVVFWWRGNISGPKNIHLWTDLVKEFIKHCINRYGLKEVETWYFEVWNEPELEYVFWIGDKESYFEFYKETVLAVKSISDKLKVGGPSITHQILKDGTWFEDYLTYCKDNKAPLDFVSLHIYPEDFSSEEEVENIITSAKQGGDPLELMAAWQWMKRIYYDKHHTYDTIHSALDKINIFLPHKPELHITEWNASSYGRNLINDTCFIATFIISNILKCIGKVDSLGYWTFTDIMEEAKAGISAFHGGFGLINKNGLKKPSYFAYYLLSKLGDRIIAQGEEYIITRKEADIQILAYNYAYFDELFLNGDTSALTNKERYLVYEAKPNKEIELNLNELSGNYKVIRYQLNREHGSVFDEWIRMGSVEDMTQEELDYLKAKSQPKMTVEYLNIDGSFKEKIYLPVHGVELIILQKNL